MSHYLNRESAKRPQKLHIEFERVTHDDDDCKPTDFDCYDADQIQAFRRGEWGFIGIQARASLMIPIGGNSFRLMTLDSAGLWGIESDSDESYLDSVFADEKRELIEQIRTLGESLMSGDFVTSDQDIKPAARG